MQSIVEFLPILAVILAALVLVAIVAVNLRTARIHNSGPIALCACFLVYGALGLPTQVFFLHIGVGIAALVGSILMFASNSLDGGTAKFGAASFVWVLPSHLDDMVTVIFILSCFLTAGLAHLMASRGRNAPGTLLFAPTLFYVFYQILAQGLAA